MQHNRLSPATPQAAAKTRDRTRLNFFLDLGLALFFAVEMEVHFTGLALHELLGLFFAAVLAVHVALHWDWIVPLTRTFFRKLVHESRLNYALDVALLVAVVVVTATGIAISETLGLNLGLNAAALTDLQVAHALSSHLLLIVTALHLALHWRWLASNAGRLLARIGPPNRPAQSPAEPACPIVTANHEVEAKS